MNAIVSGQMQPMRGEGPLLVEEGAAPGSEERTNPPQTRTQTGEKQAGEKQSGREQPSRTAVQVPGRASVEEVIALRAQLLARVDDGEPVLVADCGRDAHAGLGVLQLLLATEAALALRGKTLRLAAIGPDFRRDLELAGLRGWFLEWREGETLAGVPGKS